MSELVLSVLRDELTKQGVSTAGLYPIDLSKVDQSAFAWLPRHVADDKTPRSIGLGVTLPQILGYFQITDEEGRILTYYRKGKEEGLKGKRSIGVGGHVDLADSLLYDADAGVPYAIDNLVELIRLGAQRELAEEINLSRWIDPAKFTHILASYADPTSMVHVGLPVEINVACEDVNDKLVISEDEFLDHAWLTKEELKADLAAGTEYETWTRILIESF